MIQDTVETPSNKADTGSSISGDPIVFIPAGKLDADQYMVSDLDGVTESLFGSGNMNFLMMQSAQTNSLAATNNGIDHLQGEDLPLATEDTAGNGRPPHFTVNGGSGNLGTRINTGSEEFIDFAEVSGNTNNAASVTSLGHAASASGTTRAQASSFVQNISDSGPNLPPAPPASSVDGNSGTNGNHGTDGSNGTGLGDTIVNNLTDVVENITEIINTLPDVTNIVENITNTTTDLLTTVTNNVHNTINDIIGGGPELFPIGLNLLFEQGQSAGVNLDLLANNAVTNVLNETLDTTALTDVTGGLADISSLLGVNFLLFPLTPDTNPNDEDINVLGDFHLPFLPPIDFAIPLDPLEALVGDIDLNTDLTNALVNGLLGGDEADTDLDLNTGIGLVDNTVLDDGINLLLNPVENLLGDADLGANLGLGLLGNTETDDTAGDTDITLPLDLNITNADILNDALALSLDPLESIIGDIDLDIIAATNLFGNAADNLIDAENGGNNDGGLLSMLGDNSGALASPLFPENAPQDTDLDLGLGSALLDVPFAGNTLDIALDPVEDLTGDLDLSLVPALDILGTGQDSDLGLLSGIDLAFIDNPLTDESLDQGVTLENIPLVNMDTGLFAGADILGDIALGLVDSEPGGSGGDTALSGIGDDLANSLNQTLEPHDGVLFGDAFSGIDSTLDTAFDLLNASPDVENIIDLSLLDDAAEGTSGLLWTENTFPDASGLLGGGLGAGLSDILPDPIGDLPDLAGATQNLPGGEKLFGGLFG